MSVGENIRRMRKQRGLTIKQLGDLVGVSESYIRAYESGRRNPKPGSLQTIADALGVNVEVLKDSDVDGITAMHRLSQMFRNFGGELMEVEDKDGSGRIAITFNSLTLMRSWYNRYVDYEKEIEKADTTKNVKKRQEALENAEKSFDWWMDIYPASEPNPDLLKIQQSHDQFMNQTRLNPKDTK